MEGLINGIWMSFTFLLFLIFLRKKYDFSIKMMVILHVLFTITGAFGASLGAVLSGMSWAGKRLHMLMAVDSITLTFLCKLLKEDENHMGDYLAIPVVAVCAAAKVGCVLCDCCYGIIMFVNSEGVAVRFPSASFELGMWILLVFWLLAVERKGTVKGFLWPIALIWFGILRFLVDFMRGSSIERQLTLMGIPIGGFWSLVVLVMGVTYLICFFRRKYERNPSLMEMLRISIAQKWDRTNESK